MKTIGIVCEYNPFHRGHLYQIEESRRLCGDALIICALSGDVVQRGEAALFTKYARAEAACRCGADLVFELPLPWCIRSAEGFAFGAVSILAGAGCEVLSFGGEGASADVLRRLAEADMDEKVREEIRQLLKTEETLSFAQARQQILFRHFGEDASALSRPNDILAVEYLKAIAAVKPEIEPLRIPRKGAEHDVRSDGIFRSAMDLRESLERGEQISSSIPDAAWEVFLRELGAGRKRDKKRMELVLKSRLLQLRASDFDSLPDAGDGAGRRLYKALSSGESLETCAHSASTRRYSQARMRRLVLYAAFGIRADCIKDTPPYMRLLACNGKGRDYLAQHGDHFSIPVLTKPAAARSMGERAEEIFELGAYAHELYKLQFVADDDKAWGTDWRTGPFIG